MHASRRTVTLAATAGVILTLVGGGVANAAVFATADSPLTLSQSGTQLAQARGSVSDASGSNLSYTAAYQRDRSVNGDGVYTKVDTDYQALTYNEQGQFIGNFTYNNTPRVRTKATTSAAWTRQTDVTKSIVSSPLFQTLSTATYVVDVRICEDRGILHPDVCKTKTLTLTN
jgi:hypothetical protein